MLRILTGGNDNDPSYREPGPASEVDCLRHVFAPAVLAAAEARSVDVAVGADQVLIRQGLIDEAAYLDYLSAHTGIDIETFADVNRSECLLSDPQFIYAARHGILPLRRNGELLFVVAPWGFTARRVSRLAKEYPSLAGRARLASRDNLNQFLLQQAPRTFDHSAAHALNRRWPHLSAAPKGNRARLLNARWLHVAIICALAGLLMLTSMPLARYGGDLLAVWFLAFIGLRFAASLMPRPETPRLSRVPDDRLPVYTVIAALYREARSVPRLMQALNALDYPREKLDIIVVTELDDLATRAALARLGPMPHLRILTAPSAGPRTKPKALNHGLTFARGSFTAIFDAEDRPDAGQLRAAFDEFRIRGPQVACVQASLCIENNKESWLSRMFAAEYAGQFDVFLPGLAAFGVPLPLGGTSNHFRTSVLREVGGWDAYNVTEDADLGFRLARFGYRSATFVSTTDEEAPTRFDGWLKQRTRWMKGWMQTWSVHMRTPIRFWREAKPSGFLTLNAIIGGNVLSALAFPFLVGNIVAHSIKLAPPWLATTSVSPLHLIAVVAGLLSTIAIGLAGLTRRGHLRDGWIFALTPLYWACLSIAAWRALYQLFTDPYRWEKTEHGLSRDIRRTPRSRITRHSGRPQQPPGAFRDSA